MTRLSLPESLEAVCAVSAIPAEAPQKEQSAAAHALLAQALPYYAAERGVLLPHAADLLRTEAGKPYFPESPVQFNLSHCKGLAVCLLASRPCGIDAEQVRPFREGVVRRAYSEEERQALAAADVPDMLFTRLWTLKEAYVKAIGVGISYPLREVSFDLSGDAIACTRPDADFWQTLHEGFVISVCVLR